MVALAGAGPWPQITSTRSFALLYRIAGRSPPGPFRCGSTICSAKPVATAASKALPPRSRMDLPTAEAIQWVEVTTPKVPVVSGRGGKFNTVLSIQLFAIVGVQIQGGGRGTGRPG